MDGSVSLGEHHLVIEPVQLSDDAEFQCQVTPAAGDPPLAGTARLSVIGQLLLRVGNYHGFPPPPGYHYLSSRPYNQKFIIVAHNLCYVKRR